MEMLYHSVSDLVRLANEHQIPLWKVVLLADVQERQVTVEESFETMRQMYQAMRQADQEKEMIDQLRCRNGNLEISVSRQESGASEL